MALEASERRGLIRACRDAAIAALITCGLLLPLIGFNTVQNIHNELILETRWPLLAILVAIIAGGRFIYSLLIAPWLEETPMQVLQQTLRDLDRAWSRWASHMGGMPRFKRRSGRQRIRDPQNVWARRERKRFRVESGDSICTRWTAGAAAPT